MAGKDRKIGACQQGANPGLEGADRATRRSGALREENQDIARVCEQLLAQAQVLARLGLAMKWQRIGDQGGHRNAWWTRKEIIRRRGREDLVDAPEGQRRHQTQRVEVARVVGDQDE
jgi:hypothetical protein